MLKNNCKMLLEKEKEDSALSALAEKILSLNLEQVAQLSKILCNKIGVSFEDIMSSASSSNVAAAPAVVQETASDSGPEKFDLILKKAPDKMSLIRVVKSQLFPNDNMLKANQHVTEKGITDVANMNFVLVSGVTKQELDQYVSACESAKIEFEIKKSA